MAVFFHVAIAVGPDRRAAEAVLEHVRAHPGLLRLSIDLDSNGMRWVRGALAGLSVDSRSLTGSPAPKDFVGRDSHEGLRSIEHAFELLRSAPLYRCAACGPEFSDVLGELGDGAPQDGSLVISDSAWARVGFIADEALFEALGRPPEFEEFAPGRRWIPCRTATPLAYRTVRGLLDQAPLVDACSVSELCWDEAPNVPLFRVGMPDGEVFLAPTRGRWHLLAPQRSPHPSIPFLGRLHDALVFGSAPSALAELLYDRGGQRLPMPEGSRNPLGGEPHESSPGYAVWSHFPERVFRPAVDAFFDVHPEITTLKATAIEAHAGGLCETLILHSNAHRYYS